MDTSDTHAVQRALEGVDALVHTAIANDFQNLDSGAAYNAYPGLSPLRGQDSGGGPMVDAKASVEFLRAVAAEATV